MYDLSSTTILTFEIGNDCNLKDEHSKCPINRRKYINDTCPINVDKILECIENAKKMKFNGYIAFHYYNEPLLYLNKILEVISRHGDDKYLLWTNGLLFNKNIRENAYLKKFSKVCITCYFKEYLEFFKKLQLVYTNISILDGYLDERLRIYESSHNNSFGCKRPLFELPIDYFGNIHLCCYDWNNSFDIGNVNKTSLEDIVNGDTYQNLLAYCKKRLIDYKISPKICMNCESPLVRYIYGRV